MRPTDRDLLGHSRTIMVYPAWLAMVAAAVAPPLRGPGRGATGGRVAPTGPQPQSAG
ncbi:hypothetical protein AB0O01_31005 [Streptomyces sp. NPDC093252]|uniref:hypothetical protein n=1 Tax=Streptomyces sp. NPDC093252 TaxID=3154980 RepID=UPI003422A99D